MKGRRKPVDINKPPSINQLKRIFVLSLASLFVFLFFSWSCKTTEVKVKEEITSAIKISTVPFLNISINPLHHNSTKNRKVIQNISHFDNFQFFFPFFDLFVRDIFNNIWFFNYRFKHFIFILSECSQPRLKSQICS